MMATALVTGSRDTGTLTFWDADGKIQQICYYPAITDASFNHDWPGGAYKIAHGTGPIAIVYEDSSRVQFIDSQTLAYMSTYQYDTANSRFPYAVFAVGADTWVFYYDWSGASPVIGLDTFDAAGNLASTITLGNGRLVDVATWDHNTFYMLIGVYTDVSLYRWTVGDPTPTFIRHLNEDGAAGQVGGLVEIPTLCLHGPDTVAVSVATFTNSNSPQYSNIALFDLTNSAAFIKRYMVSDFPQFSQLPEASSHRFTFGLTSDGSTIYTGTQNGYHLWKINTSTDVVTIFNQDVQVFNWFDSTDPRYGPPNNSSALIPAIFPATPAEVAANTFTHSADGMLGFNVRDFAGKVFSFAHADGLSDATDYRFWPLPSIPNLSGLATRNRVNFDL